MGIEDDWERGEPMSPEEQASLQKAFDEGRVDFSRFHPLDHRFWQCWSRNRRGQIYGKTWTHLKYHLMYRR